MNWTANREPSRRYQSKLDASFQASLQAGAINWPPLLALLTDLLLWVAIGSVIISMASRVH
jgi:hypothetical protein